MAARYSPGDVALTNEQRQVLEFIDRGRTADEDALRAEFGADVLSLLRQLEHSRYAKRHAITLHETQTPETARMPETRLSSTR